MAAAGAGHRATGLRGSGEEALVLGWSEPCPTCRPLSQVGRRRRRDRKVRAGGHPQPLPSAQHHPVGMVLRARGAASPCTQENRY